MREYNHNNELRILLTQVIDALGNVVIKRVNRGTGNTDDNIHVNLRYSPKSRVIHDIVNKSQHIELPVMALSIGGINYDSSRTFNKIAGFYTDIPAASAFGKHYQPLPIELSLNLSILTRYQNDLDQIITCLYTFFHPYITFSYTHPEVQQEVRCVLKWDGGLNIQYPNDVAANLPYRVTCDSSFKAYGWIYRNNDDPVGKIYKIDSNFQAVSAIDDVFSMLDDREDINTDSFTISARPQLTQVNPFIAMNQLTAQSFTVVGKMFNELSSVFVSGTENVYPNAYEVDYFADFPKLSATYPAFTGLSVEGFQILSDNAFTFTLPEPQTIGNVTVIGVNEAGYGNLVVDSVIPTFNPYLSTMPEYNTYVQPQFEWVDGIEVKEP